MFFFSVMVDGLSKPEIRGHVRSESSSDSFVCVSEGATNEGERGVSQEREMWEVVGGESPESKPNESQSGTGNKEEFDIDDLLKDEPSASATKEADKKVEPMEDSNSDWEDWDD